MHLRIGTSMPPLSEATLWLNGEFTPSDTLGHSTLLQFWAVSCPICKMNLPRFQELGQIYAGQGLWLISVHRPCMEADMDVNKVKAAIQEMGLTGPRAIDNNYTIGDRFQVQGWPSYFLFDAKGRLRSRAAGALGLKLAENSLKRMLEVEEKEVAAA